MMPNCTVLTRAKSAGENAKRWSMAANQPPAPLSLLRLSAPHWSAARMEATKILSVPPSRWRPPMLPKTFRNPFFFDSSSLKKCCSVISVLHGAGGGDGGEEAERRRGERRGGEVKETLAMEAEGSFIRTLGLRRWPWPASQSESDGQTDYCFGQPARQRPSAANVLFCYFPLWYMPSWRILKF